MSAVIGIDASNIRQGGGRTYLIELLRHVSSVDVVRIYVWANPETLDCLPDLPVIHKIALHPKMLGMRRLVWQTFSLARAARELKCDVLFFPGGSYLGRFRPFGTISQNLLPFQFRELARFGASMKFAKMLALRFVQGYTFRRAAGVIFLTRFARSIVFASIGELSGSAIIPHGIGEHFRPVNGHNTKRAQENFSSEGKLGKCNVLYVSTVDQYKHQWNVVDAVHKLRQKGQDVHLTLAGPASSRHTLARLERHIRRLDPARDWVSYVGSVAHEDLPDLYQKADIGVFASSCENLPIILLEMMGTGLPICCSNMGPMPEVLGEAGVYFDPLNASSIADTLELLLGDHNTRHALSKKALAAAQEYSWIRSARETISYILMLARNDARHSSKLRYAPPENSC
jgi:glycosyltransferase involved in cell wall biosynthesis